ncbi:hypothetical protein SAY86_032190 [Trapa natans]|uniref:Uncharacterized protein n=1 Tax=Trapa natans TaxID=22666 RepID=A0AAN7R6S3_TRANT|nr:hypothetical protein SAY86_032190 [Trapa natans]
MDDLFFLNGKVYMLGILYALSELNWERVVPRHIIQLASSEMNHFSSQLLSGCVVVWVVCARPWRPLEAVKGALTCAPRILFFLRMPPTQVGGGQREGSVGQEGARVWICVRPSLYDPSTLRSPPQEVGRRSSREVSGGAIGRERKWEGEALSEPP